MGYWLHTRLSHYSETFNQAIHTMTFVKRPIAKTRVGCIQGTSLCLRNRFLFFCNEHAQSTTVGPKLIFRVVSASKTVLDVRPPPKLMQRVGHVDEMAQNTSFRCKVCGANPSGCFRAPKWCENTQNMSFRPKVLEWACLLQKNKKQF